jgi:hypothetical protein
MPVASATVEKSSGDGGDDADDDADEYNDINTTLTVL